VPGWCTLAYKRCNSDVADGYQQQWEKKKTESQLSLRAEDEEGRFLVEKLPKIRVAETYEGKRRR